MRTVLADVKSRRFIGSFLKEFLAAVGLLAGALQLLDVLFDSPFKHWGLAGVTGVAIAGVAWAAWRCWPRPIEHHYSANFAIRIVRGDLLAETGHLVIGACDTFDTQVPRVISRNSLQGQALNRLWGDDETLLDADLDAALAGQAPSGTVKKEGKTERYPVGTVAPVIHSGRRIFFVAYTEMNEHNEARASTDGIWKSLLQLWAAVSRDANGGAVAVPVIGQGQARIAQILPAQDAIRLTILSFVFASRREKVCDELRIVVMPELYERLDRLELQAFLDSLEMTS